MKIPIIDLFAGPGGLGEGFSAYQTPEGRYPFQISLSIEKDPYAYQTLTLRSFFRQFGRDDVPEEYYDFLRNADKHEVIWQNILSKTHPQETEKALVSALLAELGEIDTKIIRENIRNAIEGKENFVLLGGPPCQAYSVMGRSRNKGNPNYKANEDKRQSLYVEYLQVLADHHPAIFIMENVKGLLSATLENQHIFDRILNDLPSPCEAGLRVFRIPVKEVDYER